MRGDWRRVGGEGKTKRGVKEEVRRRGVGEEWRGGAEMRRGEEWRRVGGEGMRRRRVDEEGEVRRGVGEELPKINPREPNSLPSNGNSSLQINSW